MSGDRYMIQNQNGLYFITFTVVGWLDVFTRASYKVEIVNSLNYCVETKGLIVYAWCLMSNHLHLIISAKDGFRLSAIIRDFKKFTAKRIIHMMQNETESRVNNFLHQFEYFGSKLKRVSKYKFWKDDNHAVELDSNMIEARLNYIHQNPVKALLVEDEIQYLMSSARDYSGIKGLVNIEYLR